MLSNFAILAETGGGAYIAGIVVAIIIVFVLFLLIWSRLYIKVGPNEALIVSGAGGIKVVTGGAKFVVPIFQKVDHLSLESMLIEFRTPEVYTKDFIPVIAEGVSQLKVAESPEGIRTAAVQFLSKTKDELKRVCLETLEGHLRAIIATMTLEEMYRNREQFNQKLQEVSQDDFAKMGLKVISLQIKEIRDTVAERQALSKKGELGYVEAIGITRIADVIRDARKSKALADQQAVEAEQAADSIKRQAIASRDLEASKKEADVAKEKSNLSRDVEINKANNLEQQNVNKAKADNAYAIQDAIQRQTLKNEDMRVIEVEKEKMISITERQLEATVRKPAEAKRYQIEQEAGAERTKMEQEAQGKAAQITLQGKADGDATRNRGLAEAEVIGAKLNAEADGMRKKAEAWKQYNEAAIGQLFIEKLPDIARAISEPLGKVEKIVMISNGGDGVGSSRITQEIINILTQLPPTLEAITGIQVKDLIGKLKKDNKS